MKHWKHILFSALSFIAVAATVLISACVDNSCTHLNCKNGGTCAENFCRCKTGFDGAECENKIALRFLGTYTGSTRCSDYVTKADTLWVTFAQEPNVVRVIRSQDKGSVYTGRTIDNRIVIDQINNGGNIQNVNGIISDHNKKMEFYVEYFNENTPNVKNVCSFFGYKE